MGVSPARGVDVWIASLDRPAGVVLAFAKSLSDDERLRASRLIFEEDRRRFVVRRGVLRAILALYLKMTPRHVRFRYGNHGKPALIEPSGPGRLRFNLSHSAGFAAYAVTCEAEIGIDIERVGQIPEYGDIAERYFSDDERQSIGQAPPGEREGVFLRTWTRKEAWGKARGDGLGGLDDKGFDGEGDWNMVDFSPAPRYVGAIAVARDRSDLDRWRWFSFDSFCSDRILRGI